MGKIITTLMAVVLSLTAAGLTVILMRGHDEALLPLLYVLLPGVITSLLITGGHGGTATQEMIGAIFGAAVNAAFYGSIPFLARAVWRVLKSTNPIPKQPE